MAWPDRVAATAAVSDAGSVTTKTLALGQTATAGNTLFAIVRRGTDIGTITVDDGTGAAGSSNVFTLDKGILQGANLYEAVYRLSNIPAGITQVRVTFDVARTLRLILEEYTGNSALHGVPVAATGLTGTPDSGAQTTTATCLLIGAGGLNAGNETFTAGTNWTLDNVVPAAGTSKNAEENQGSGVGGVAAGTYNATFSLSPTGVDTWAAVLCAYTNAGGAAAAMPPGVISVVPGAPRQPDDRSYIQAGSDLWLQSQPNPKMPPGQQVVTPAALPPHAGDNWTFTQSVLTIAPPPGKQLLTPGATQQPGPTFAPGSAIAVVSTPQAPQPAGIQQVDPGARQLAGPTFASSLARGFDTVPSKQPPGAQVVTPAAVAPHAADNWSLGVSVYPGMAAATLPPGRVFVAPAAVPPHTSDNWTFAASLNRGFDTVPAKQPPGQQVVAPPAVPPHAADNWTASPSLNLGLATPLPEPVGVQAIDPPPPGPHARDNNGFVGSLFPGMASPLAMPPGAQLVVAVPAYARADASFAQSPDLAQTQPPIGKQSIDVPGVRPRDDRSLTPSLFPGMGGPVGLPSGQILVVPPPKPQLAGVETFIGGARLELIATPQSPLPPGQQVTNYVLVWRQAPNYTSVLSSPIALNSTPQRDLSYALGAPQSAWSMQGPRSGWRQGEPHGDWTASSPQE